MPSEIQEPTEDKHGPMRELVHTIIKKAKVADLSNLDMLQVCSILLMDIADSSEVSEDELLGLVKKAMTELRKLNQIQPSKSEPPHADGDYSKTCGNDHCRCMQ